MQYKKKSALLVLMSYGRLEQTQLAKEIIRLAKLRGDINPVNSKALIATHSIDCAWTKETHKTAAGTSHDGFTVIDEAATKKIIISIETLHNFCQICALAFGKSEVPREHNCLRSDISSQKMEAAGIFKGIVDVGSNLGLEVRLLIKDGDCAVMAEVRANKVKIPQEITDINCANHVRKCARHFQNVCFTPRFCF